MQSFTKISLAVYAAVKFLLVVGFIVSLNIANNAVANEDVAKCSGEDLIAQLTIEDPVKLAELKMQAAQTPNANSRLWKISKPNTPDSWLFGTMHLADERIIHLPHSVETAFTQSKTIILENTQTLDKQKAQTEMRKLGPMTMILDGSTLDATMDEDTKSALRDALWDRSLPYPIAIRMQPWLLATMVAVPACELAAKKAGKPVLDGMLAKRAQENGKQLIGLETIEEQFTAISSLPREFHESALVETLKLGSTIDDMMETMKLLYIKGEIGMILPLMRHISPQTTSSSGFADFQEKLVVSRNKTMAERATKHLENGNAFIAVGALHLPGETGLVHLFRQSGYTLTAINPPAVDG